MTHVSLVTKCFVIASNKKVLILKRTDTAKIRPGMWDLPGGMVDDKENPNIAIIREIKEETTIETDRPRVIFVATELLPAYIITLFYKSDYNRGAVEIGPEHTGYRWIDMNEFLNLDLPEKFKQAAAFLQ